MSKLTATHLPPLADAFNEAVVNGTITVHDAMAFYEAIEDAVFTARVREGFVMDKDHPPLIKRRKSNGSFLRHGTRGKG
jgi:hypothetical protein